MAGPAHERDVDNDVGDAPTPDPVDPPTEEDAGSEAPDESEPAETERGPLESNGPATAPDDGGNKPAVGWSRWLDRLRAALGVAVVGVALAAIVVYGLPPSPLSGKVPQWAYTVGDAVSLNQNWALFAPDPPTTDVQLDFVVTDADGTVTVESLPSGPIWLPTVRSERWRKVRERVTPTSQAERWPEVLEWSLAQLRERGRDPQTIELRRRWTDRAADDPGSEGTEQTFTFARLEVPSGNYVVLDPDAPGAVVDKPTDASPDGQVERSDQ